MIDDNNVPSVQLKNTDWSNVKCDKYDYIIAVFCGVAAGIIDVLFVGDPISGTLGNSVDKTADEFVKKAAQFLWKNDTRSSGKSKKMPESLEQCISYLEQAFPVPYDARYAQDLNVKDGILSGMRPGNHHVMSLAHYPDIIGLIFSIIDQFTGYATFVDKGEIIHIAPKKNSGAIPYMQGSNLPSKLFCGFVNWIGHIISDLVGSSSTRKTGKTGRGSGIPIPFYQLFLSCDFGNIEGNTFAETMIKVFEDGYDLRFGVTMAIPVLFEELSIRVIWTIRQKFFRRKSWKESIPTSEHTDLRIMLIVGNSALCLIDNLGAAAMSGGNAVGFILHLNLVAWARLVMLVLKELRIRYGSALDEIINGFIDNVMTDICTPNEKQQISEFYQYLEQYDRELNKLFYEFTLQVEAEYKKLYAEIDATFSNENSSEIKAQHSILLAEVSGVSEDRIIRSHSELDNLFG